MCKIIKHSIHESDLLKYKVGQIFILNKKEYMIDKIEIEDGSNSFYELWLIEKK